MPRRSRSLHPIEPGGSAVVVHAAAASALLDPTRRRIMTALQAPASATSIAGSLRLSRQLVNYHVRALEKAGLIEEVERRQRRGVQERIVRATASHYLISPEPVGELSASPAAAAPDRFSATFQVAVAARTIREVAALAELASGAGKRLTTLTIDTEVRLSTPAAREAFGNELVAAVNALAAKYHDADAPDGRAYRVFVGAHPVYVPQQARRSRPQRRKE